MMRRGVSVSFFFRQIVPGLLLCMLLVSTAWAKDVTFNFRDADIRAFIEFVAGLTHKSFLVDNRVKGKITIISPAPIPERDAYKVFLSILEVNGYTAIENGDVVKIIPVAEGKQRSMPVTTRAIPGTGDALVTQIITLSHANAQQLMAVLRPLVSPNSNLTVYAPGNMLVLTDTASNARKIRRIVESIDTRPPPEEGKLFVRYLKNADAEDMAKVIDKLIGSQKGGNKLFQGDVHVVADSATNALLITAGSADRAALNALIDKLDIRRLQVLIEALIIEVSASTSQQFGIEWRATGDFTSPGRKAVGGTVFSSQANTSINTVAANPLSAGNGLVVGVVDGTITFGGTTFANLGALLRALEAQADTNVLSTPNILTMDNEEAEIIVGQNVPFITGQNVTQGGTANPFQTIERKDIGLKLRVKPQISEGDAVRLEIFQEISSVESNPAVTASDITTNKRSVKTTVLANNGQIVVLGGLMRDDTTTSVQRVPCLGSVPVLGEAFKFTDNTRRKTNLMVFLRPHIIKTARDIETITQGKYLDIKKLYDDQPYEGTMLFPQNKTPLPPGMNPLPTAPEDGQRPAGKAADPGSATP